MPIPPRGPAIAHFLMQFFEEDLSERPEFELGFAALRRAELLTLADIADIHIPLRDMPAKQMRLILNAALAEGKFDKFIKEPVDPKDAELAAMKKKMAELEAMIGGKTKPKPQKMTKRGPGEERKKLINRANELGFGGGAATASTSSLQAFVGAKEAAMTGQEKVLA